MTGSGNSGPSQCRVSPPHVSERRVTVWIKTGYERPRRLTGWYRVGHISGPRARECSLSCAIESRRAFACGRRSLLLPARCCSPRRRAARAAVSDVQPIDGPSARRDRRRGRGDGRRRNRRDRLPQTGRRPQPRLRRPVPRRRVGRAAAGRRRPELRLELGANRRRDGGRLVVTWVQEFGVESDRMFSATLDPGATGFQDPVPVDFNVGEATSTYPDLAMNSGGQAYLVYLVDHRHQPRQPARLPRHRRSRRPLQQPALVGAGQPDRPQHRRRRCRAPTAATARRSGSTSHGQARRRLAGARRRIRRPRLGAARVRHHRRHPTPGEPRQLGRRAAARRSRRLRARRRRLRAGGGRLPPAARPVQQAERAAIFVNEMPDAFANGASAFGGARLVDGGAQGGLGAPSVAVEPERRLPRRLRLRDRLAARLR